MLRTLTIIACLTSLLAGCATGSSTRSAAQAMQRDLEELKGEKGVAGHSEEYLSFVRTVDAADRKLESGREVEADELYRLAVAKGYVLRQSLLQPAQPAPSPPAAPAPPPPAVEPEPKPQAEASVPPPEAPAAPGPVAVEPAPPAPTIVKPDPDKSAAAAEPPAPAVVVPPPAVETPPARKEIAPPILSERIVGGEGVYVVRKNDTLRMIGSRLGMNWRRLAKRNRLPLDKPLQTGQKIRYNNRKIVPKMMKEGIVVNIPERKLYLFKDDRLLARYPVAAGMSKKKEKTIWRTPTGRFRIVDKKENPTWRVPPSIQQEMEEEGVEVVEEVPPGPKNPLGKYALKTSLAGILIHSTIRPASINTYSSHGCIRVMPEHMEALFREVRVNMPGEIIYQPIKVEVTADGRVFLEVNSDIYEQVKDMRGEVKRLLARKGVAKNVSWEKIDRLIRERTGVAEEVTLKDDLFVATVGR